MFNTLSRIFTKERLQGAIFASIVWFLFIFTAAAV